MGPSGLHTILKKKLILLASFISNTIGEIFKVVPYQEVNIGTASFSCKRILKAIVIEHFPIFYS